MEKTMEQAQMLARFKLQVKRTIGETVDLDLLSRDPVYAKMRLAEIEDLAEDEDLLIMVLRIRDLVLPVERISSPLPSPLAVQETAPLPKETRNYLMGARAW